MASVSMTESLTCGRVSNKSDGQWNIKLLILRAIALFFFLLIHTNIKRWNRISATSFFLFCFSSLINGQNLIREKALIPLNLTMKWHQKNKNKVQPASWRWQIKCIWWLQSRFHVSCTSHLLFTGQSSTRVSADMIASTALPVTATT